MLHSLLTLSLLASRRSSAHHSRSTLCVAQTAAARHHCTCGDTQSKVDAAITAQRKVNIHIYTQRQLNIQTHTYTHTHTYTRAGKHTNTYTQRQVNIQYIINNAVAFYLKFLFNHLRLEEILTLGNFVSDVNWLNFLSLSCTSLENNLTDAVTLLCKILSKDPEGGSLHKWFQFLHTFSKFCDCS